jgi:uncharacterized membrane protein
MNSISTEGGDRDGSVSNGDGDSSLEVAAAGAVTAITLGVAFGLLALGQSYFWIAFPIGFGAGMPLAVGLARWYRSSAATDRSARQDHAGTDAALTHLRERYARGELTDEEFESRVERLLETESVADAKTVAERERETGEDARSVSEREPATSTAKEDRQT